ncbi:hypothetical protein AGABI1DRAFT_133824 [Agaricus bisporus var. burnettii JB137-S8]|uniref:Uncharacterized protein n=1 Tax=Agaricus bisporus var. burnettii (strain JB137-S8 / ATCC MYA-4627 / FGSC 10392) TaxID=597362 RepID=K5XHQ5_AGABU|nr:uncharacterized protein AGABI1DRAFT_133824 [Agaricus bisporus var. burnettii JB137-S8]EKM73955.1 hypothetical protein AGABI1DRAFT_133824 [Agaricus bisporus var. burnettii JB137-S8]
MARQILNPKPNKPGEALLIASPREQIQIIVPFSTRTILDKRPEKNPYPRRTYVMGDKRRH